MKFQISNQNLGTEFVPKNNTQNIDSQVVNLNNNQNKKQIQTSKIDPENPFDFINLAIAQEGETKVALQNQNQNLGTTKKFLGTDEEDLWEQSKQPISASKENPLYRFVWRWSKHPNNSNIFFEPEKITETFIKLLGPTFKPNTLIFQLEKGEITGLEHYQGCIKLENKIRISQLIQTLRNDFFGIEIRQAAAKNFKDCIDYCSKDDTRIAGPFGFPKISKGEDTGIIVKNPYPWQSDI
jgi:hypothetical protein